MGLGIITCTIRVRFGAQPCIVKVTDAGINELGVFSEVQCFGDKVRTHQSPVSYSELGF